MRNQEILNNCENQSSEAGLITVNNEFGTFQFDLQRQIAIKDGLIGLSKYKKFVLIDINHPKFPGFFLLQSTETKDLKLLVLPVDFTATNFYENGEIEAACENICLDPKNVTCFLVVSVAQNEENQKILTVNAKAPLLITIDSREGTQVVLQNEKYQVQTPLSK